MLIPAFFIVSAWKSADGSDKNIRSHLHLVFNAVSHIDGHRYRGGKKEYAELYHLIRGYRIRKLIPVDYREEDGEEQATKRKDLQ